MPQPVPAAPPEILQKSWELLLPFAGQSSPVVTDVNGDGSGDVVLGTGIYRPDGRNCALVALDGRSGRRLWQVPLPGDGFATPLPFQVNSDGIPDLIMAGRFPDVLAVDGRRGEVLWQLSRANPGWLPGPMNFNTAVALPDRDGDGHRDLLLVQGGAHPDTRVIPGRLFVVSGRDGRILHERAGPDGGELYGVPAVVRAGGLLAVTGSGGERLGGHLMAVELDGLRERWRVPATGKGFVASPLVHSMPDGPRVVAVSFGGRVFSVVAATGRVVWSRSYPGYETYASPAWQAESAGGSLYVALSRGVWPSYDQAMLVRLDAATGAEQARFPAGRFISSSPILADADGDGHPEVVLLSNDGFQPDAKVGAGLHILRGRDLQSVHSLSLKGFSAATPLVTVRRPGEQPVLVAAWWGRVALFHLPRARPGPRLWHAYRGPWGNGSDFPL